MVLQEGVPGNERLVIPACTLTAGRLATVAVALVAAAIDLVLLYRMLTLFDMSGAEVVAHLLATLFLSFAAVIFGSESVRILTGRESLSWEDVFLVHEMAEPLNRTTRTQSLSRITGLQVERFRSPHPNDLARLGKAHLVVKTRDGPMRVGFGLSTPDLERMRALAERNMTAARIRIGIREGSS